MMKIKSLSGRQISDSRDNPTIEVELELEDGSVGVASVPAGASTGRYEAVDLPVIKTLANFDSEIASKIISRDFDQTSLDCELIALDGTPNKSRLGTDAILAISLAFARASAKSQNKELFEMILGVFRGETSGSLEDSPQKTPDVGSRTSRSQVRLHTSLPTPMFNILNGGRHANNGLDIQEFMIVPKAPTFREALNRGDQVYQALKKVLLTKNLETDLGDEGGFAPTLAQNTKALDLLVEAIKQAGYTPSEQIALALDIAGSELKTETGYLFKKSLPFNSEGRQIFTNADLIKTYEQLIEKYPIISIEDGLGEDDWAGWQDLTAKLGSKINLVGDDLFTTNPARLREGIIKKTGNAIIIKPNQIGTLTETLEVIKIAREAGYKIIVSHRSGETGDAFIADLAVAVSADFIKAGAPAKPERLAKYHRLLEIEKILENRK